jgi:hypothetical protein
MELLTLTVACNSVYSSRLCPTSMYNDIQRFRDPCRQCCIVLHSANLNLWTMSSVLALSQSVYLQAHVSKYYLASHKDGGKSIFNTLRTRQTRSCLEAQTPDVEASETFCSRVRARFVSLDLRLHKKKSLDTLHGPRTS